MHVMKYLVIFIQKYNILFCPILYGSNFIDENIYL